jgi:hypothetical protein
MKAATKLALALAATAALATPASAAALNPPICINALLVDKQTVVDTRTIQFHTKDHKVYQTTLKANCMSLRFNGYIFVTWMDEICNGQSIRVLRTNEICVMGQLQELGQHT